MTELLSPETTAIKDTDPAVSMDINLAKDLRLEKGKVLEVDYDLLRDTLAAVHAPADNSELQVRLEANLPGDTMGGYYDEDEDEKLAVVGLTPNNMDETQNILEHELQHYADASTHLTKSKLGDLLFQASFKHGKKTVKASTALSGGLVAAEIASYHVDRPSFIAPEVYNYAIEKLDQAVAPMGLLTLGALALSSVYYLDKAERRARHAARSIQLPPTFTIR